MGLFLPNQSNKNNKNSYFFSLHSFTRTLINKFSNKIKLERGSHGVPWMTRVPNTFPNRNQPPDPKRVFQSLFPFPRIKSSKSGRLKVQVQSMAWHPKILVYKHLNRGTNSNFFTKCKDQNQTKKSAMTKTKNWWKCKDQCHI